VEIPNVFETVEGYGEDVNQLKLSEESFELVFQFNERLESICSEAYQILEQIRKYVKNDWESHSYDYFVYEGNSIKLVGQSYDGRKQSFYMYPSELCDTNFAKNKKLEYVNIVKQREEQALQKHDDEQQKKLEEELKEFARLKEKFGCQ
jgi:hypothetical protein